MGRSGGKEGAPELEARRLRHASANDAVGIAKCSPIKSSIPSSGDTTACPSSTKLLAVLRVMGVSSFARFALMAAGERVLGEESIKLGEEKVRGMPDCTCGVGVSTRGRTTGKKGGGGGGVLARQVVGESVRCRGGDTDNRLNPS
mmetsp:Transcript_15551/g.28125  ORF Transcript_15551/g.28125 Transcript_15551/m.28125 type:complete len:145 (-) Transcript_15551:155-589(-)